MLMWQQIIDHYKLFWQYPAVTEKEFYAQNRHYNNYIGFPWATVLDKGISLEQLVEALHAYTSQAVEYYTCCQHIRFRELEKVFSALNITTVYTPHKLTTEDTIGNKGKIKLVACPLYAVNIEDPTRNDVFRDKDFVDLNRHYTYSFLGGLQPGYLTDIREQIFRIPSRSDILIQNSGEWHFNEFVYTDNNQNYQGDALPSDTHKTKTENYNKTLLNSRYSLCPSGTGPNSIRLWESLAVGAIPILLSDTLELPPHPLWDKAILRLKEKDLNNIDAIIEEITPEEENYRRSNCLKIYKYFKDHYTNRTIAPIVHYCCGSYYQGNFGGVACYDYQLSKVFPHRVFFEGPRERSEMIEFLEGCDNAIVITDNHLACDIPNQYKTFIVHHGVAMTHAEREPTWDLYWKTLCCSGQDRMLYYRDPKTTEIISVSQFCTDEFTKYYNEGYKKFERSDVLHCSELNEDKTKEAWNTSPVVLGNFSTDNKGKKIIETIQQESESKFKFHTLNIYPTMGIQDFHDRKQEVYLNSDLFLQLSLCEGFSYAALDALMMGIPVVSTDTGVFYKDVPEDCFVKIEWERNQDLDYILEKLEYAWANRDSLAEKGRSWYLANCSFKDWSNKMQQVVK